MKIAIIHDYLVQYGGAEKTLEAILEVFPEATIFTGIYNPKNMSDIINSKTVISTKSSLFSRFPKHMTFLMPFVFENFDLREFDVIISEGVSWAKGVLSTPEQLHISYVHTPPRFLYKYTIETAKRNKWYFKPIIPFIDHYLRVWDYNAAQRPDYLITNSHEVQRRIFKFYKRESKLIYPPVELDTNYNLDSSVSFKDPYYLAIGRLSAYKNFDLLIEAFNLLESKLVIAGTGVEEKKLKKLAHNNVFFTGRVTENQKRQLYDNCKGVIFPIEHEDFGIVPVEAMAFGKPVLAHRSGGPLETVIEGVNGAFFDEINVESLIKGFKEFEQNINRKKYNAEEIMLTAQKYGKDRFKKEFHKFVMSKWEEKNA